MAVLMVIPLMMAGCSTSKPAARKAPEHRVIYLSAVEFKGKAKVAKEPFPTVAPPSGGGIKLERPDEEGEWETETYHFVPGTVVAYQGDEVELRIWGVNGAEHDTVVEGYDQRTVVKRGQMSTLKFVADKPGIFRIICLNHPPIMESQLLVLPRP